MTEQPARPFVAPPIIENIPLELRQRRQWVCWRLEWRTDKWTKVPYTPGTTKHARANAPITWRSIEEAHACYLSRPDFFQGVGYEFLKDDPYVGVDFDQSIDADGTISDFAHEHMPHTYTEISQSGRGFKAIVRATIAGGRKTPKAEIYGERRFFALTGNILPGSPCTIHDGQADVDKLLAALGTDVRTVKAGTAGSGSRAERAARIPNEEWEAGRNLMRTQLGRLLARLRGSAVSRKTGTDDTQLGLLLRENYGAFAEKWPAAGIVREDGSLDRSQIRACMGSAIRSRGFTFPEFAALMGHFFGAECVAKWGTQQAFREEIASLWFFARTPRADELPTAPQPVARGRAGNHAELLDRAYHVLQDFKVGINAVIKTEEWAEALGINRRTAITLLQELAEAGRITYSRLGQYGGLLVNFPDVIYSADVIYSDKPSGDETQHEATNGYHPERTISAEEKTEMRFPDVIYSPDADADTPDEAAPNTEIELGAISAEAGLLYIESKTLATVLNPGASITSEKRPTLAEAVALALEALPHDRLIDAQTGERKRWPITAARIKAWLQETYGEPWKAQAVDYWIGRVRKMHRRQQFDDLREMKKKELESRIYAAARRIEAAERKADAATMPEIREFHVKQVAQISNYRALLEWERAEREQREAERFERDGYALVEQREMLELIDAARPQQPRPAARAAPVQPDMVSGMIARLQARKAAPD